MIELGKRQLLEVVRVKEFGVYLSQKAGEDTAVLLPKKQVPQGTGIGDKLEVFIYKIGRASCRGRVWTWV